MLVYQFRHSCSDFPFDGHIVEHTGFEPEKGVARKRPATFVSPLPDANEPAWSASDLFKGRAVANPKRVSSGSGLALDLPVLCRLTCPIESYRVGGPIRLTRSSYMPSIMETQTAIRAPKTPKIKPMTIPMTIPMLIFIVRETGIEPARHLGTTF